MIVSINTRQSIGSSHKDFKSQENLIVKVNIKKIYFLLVLWKSKIFSIFYVRIESNFKVSFWTIVQMQFDMLFLLLFASFLENK